MKRKMIIERAFLVGVLLTIAQPLWAKDKAKTNQAPEKVSGQEAAPMDQTLIKVDDQPITSREYASFLQAHPEIISRAMTTEAGKAEALRELVGAFLLKKAMYDEGLLPKGQVNPEQKQIIGAYEKLAERHFPLPPPPSDADAFAYYQANQANYGIPAMVRLCEILIKVDRASDEKLKSSAREKAQKALARLDAGEAFEKVASEVTENPIGKVTQGDIGFMDIEKEAWIKSALPNPKTGDRTSVLESPEGFVILLVSDIRPGIVSPYANVRDKVIKDIRNIEQEKLRKPYIESLAAKAKIEVISEYIKPLFPNGIYKKP